MYVLRITPFASNENADIGQAKLVGVCTVSDVLNCVSIISANAAHVNANGRNVVYAYRG